MKVHKNVLTQEVLDFHEKEIAEYMKKSIWYPSEFVWEKELTIGVTGLCLSTLVSKELHNLVESCIKDFLPKHDIIHINHCVWHKNSGISLHPDQKYKFGATIYLNKSWDMNYGGIFLWKDDADDLRSHAKKQYYGRMNAVCPTHNMLMINDNYSWHMVTSVSPLSPENRITLQIWGK